MLSTIIKKKGQEAELPKDTQVVMTAAQVTLRPLICSQLCAFYALPCPQAYLPDSAHSCNSPDTAGPPTFPPKPPPTRFT